MQFEPCSSRAGTIVITGTSDLQGNISDSGGDVTIADNASVAGTFAVTNSSAADAATITQANTGAVDGLNVNSSGTGNLFEVQDAGTPRLTVADGGNVTLANDLTVSGTAVTLPANSVDGSEASAILRTKVANSAIGNVGGVANDYIFIAPTACTVTAIKLVTSSSEGPDNANYYLTCRSRTLPRHRIY